LLNHLFAIMKKVKSVYILVFALALLSAMGLVLRPWNAFAAEPQKEKKIRTIVIDPGHGGHDSGCHGSSAYEKHVALSVSLKLGKLIEDYFPDVKVIFTRKTDVFVELYRRAQIANENQADLFICIHCNSGPKAAYGAETFVMGLHKTDDNLSVARRENAVILQEDNYENRYDGFDPNSPEAHIVFSLYQNAYLYQSLYFAEKLQHEFKHQAKRHNRGVKQAGFLVLYRTTMPSVLIETGFLTNEEEERYLKSDAGQDQMAFSIMRAFQQYKAWVDDKPDSRILAPLKSKEEDHEKEAEVNSRTEKTESNSQHTHVEPNVLFRVQIYQSPKKTSLKASVFKGRDDIWEYESDNTWKYTCGRFDKPEDAVKLQSELKKEGFTDAFVVAFNNNKRITLNEARKIMKK
jgi:N-acetylmuramoyl-L-alanine amidase